MTKKVLDTDIELHFDNYVGRFYRKDKNGRWYKFHSIGNTGIAFDVAGMLMKMGHIVEFISEITEGDI